MTASKHRHLLDDEDAYSTSVGLSGFVLEPAEWMREAACAGKSTDLFYPGKGSSATAALDVCARCRVRDECLAFAMSDSDAFSFGLWGGTTPKERRQLRRRPSVA